MNEFTEQVMQVGLTENEAKVFYVVFQLKSAAIRDIYEISHVPRNKIYGELDSLSKKGFVIKTGEKPLRYAAADLGKTFAALRKVEMDKISRVEGYLNSFEKHELQDPRPIAYDLQNTWAVENHLQNMLKRAKTELILIASNMDFFRSRFSDAQLKRFAKKLDFYVIVPSAERAKEIHAPCYILKEEFIKQFLGDSKMSVLEQSFLHVIADRRAVLNVGMNDGELFGTVIYLEHERGILEIVFETFLKSLVRTE